MANKNVTLLVVCLMVLATLQPSTATLKEEWDACYKKCVAGCTVSWLYYPCIAYCKTTCVPNLSMEQPHSLASTQGRGHGLASRKQGHGLSPESSPTPKSSPTSKNNKN